MKIKSDKTVTSDKWRVTSEGKTHHSSLVTHHSPRARERGMALVITLILLSVTLVMALAFLAVSTRERTAITTSTDTATARNAADSALAAAEAQIAANILSTSNSYNYGLLVSTNFINGFGFVNNIADVTNVNYDYLSTGGALNQNQFEQNLANLYYSPRAPVFITTNQGSPPDFRFYLDLNRNGIYDTNGVDGAGITNIGDPEWIGVLERPDAPYGPNNKFISRFLFYCLPAGNTYDLNYIYNQAATATLNLANDGYMRNQGVGSWEINLAAFLADLNTDIWLPAAPPAPAYYAYGRPANLNQGIAFEDAFALLSYRYANNYNSLATPQNLFGANAAAFQNDIDFYSDGPLMTNTAGINTSFQSVNVPWAGADNTNHFFDLSADLFDPAKSSPQFTNRLLSAGNGTSSYDRYTFYRLLDQLGTDSTPESGKMNLNYDNLDLGLNGVLNANGTASATNFVPWTPVGFFTNAADRMLQLYTANWLAADYTSYTNTFGASVTNAFGVTGIPVLVNGRFVYSSAVQRILQLAANIYDATTTNFYPSVFRPLFTQNSGDIFVTGYTNIDSVTGTTDLVFSPPFEASPTNGFGVNVAVNIYGVPWIIGAKKGFPNFNKVSMETSVQITRKLQATRIPNGISPTGATLFQYGTNQMYIMSISNFLGVGCWNSYNTPYPKTGIAPVQIALLDSLTTQLTNNQPGFSGLTFSNTYLNNPNPFLPLAGFVWPVSSDPNSFLAPLNTNSIILANCVYDYGPNTISPYAEPGFIPEALISPNNYLNTGTPQLPQFNLQTTNRLQLVMLDLTHIIDYVQLNGMDENTDLNQIFSDPDDSGWWSTNTQDSTLTGVPDGVNQQITTSRNGSIPQAQGDQSDGVAWDSTAVISAGLPVTHTEEEAYFNAFLL
jgi:hypothetical protein